MAGLHANILLLPPFLAAAVLSANCVSFFLLGCQILFAQQLRGKRAGANQPGWKSRLWDTQSAPCPLPSTLAAAPLTQTQGFVGRACVVHAGQREGGQKQVSRLQQLRVSPLQRFPGPGISAGRSQTLTPPPPGRDIVKPENVG